MAGLHGRMILTYGTRLCKKIAMFMTQKTHLKIPAYHPHLSVTLSTSSISLHFRS
jgi:uncharacterized RmlC-like cupin family protein